MQIDTNKISPIMASSKIYELSKEIIPKLAGYNINEIGQLCDILLQYAIVEIKVPSHQ